MAKQQVATTQRAYTLRLRGMDRNDNSWREALWATHVAVNKGAKMFGDWLLTLRGGLDHRLADEGPGERRKDRRILLALSWLSVESSRECLPHTVATGMEPASNRCAKVETAFRAILERRGLVGRDTVEWLADCLPSLIASIRDDAVWVNRSEAFDEATLQMGASMTREEVWDLLEPFFGSREAYFAGVAVMGEEEESGEDNAKDLCQKAGGWLSKRFGKGDGADFGRMALVYDAIAAWGSSGPQTATIAQLAEALSSFAPPSKDAAGVLSLISGPGYKSATRNLVKQWSEKQLSSEDFAKLAETAKENAQESRGKVGGKGHRAWADHILRDVEAATGITYLQNDERARHGEYAVILDHAARHVSVAHSWAKRAEARRRGFDEDAVQLGEVPPRIVTVLDQFCKERTGDSGASEAYRIRKRALEGWEDVVRAWQGNGSSEEKRIEAARLVQADPEIEKFGDIQLFEALAADELQCVWENGPEALRRYAASRQAEAMKLRFKVPAYRHPDPLRHPVFCDFGKSRWEVAFAVHEKAMRGGKKAGRGINAAWLEDTYGLQMGLWDGQAIVDQKLRWSCKRLVGDFALRQKAEGEATEVTRADRLGRGAGGADGAVRILNVFEEERWNGRLQAPRAELDRLADHVEKHGWSNERARRLASCVRWLVSFSPKLQPAGPWFEFCRGFPDDAPSRPFVSGKGEYAVKHAGNDQRKGLAKLGLCQLPGLRVLSVDLGHRAAAACAVWEELSKERFEAGCRAAETEGAGVVVEDLYARIEWPEKASKTATGRAREEERIKMHRPTQFYRRIACDGAPAPWARLDRQFMIRLQGEGDARRATREERRAVENLERELGCQREGHLPERVDDLMDAAVRLCRLGIARHGRRAKIAWALTSAYSIGPGGTKKAFEPGSGEQVEHLLRALLDWHGLATDVRWSDPEMRTLWNMHLVPPPVGAPAVPDAVSLEDMELLTKVQRKQRQQAIEKELRAVAERLCAVSRKAMAAAVDAQWAEQDQCWTGRLKWLRGWLLPRGLRKDPGKASLARRVGGLSLTRIATLKSLYQVQKAYHMRPEPCDPRKNAPKKGDERLEGFGKRVLGAMERLRDQRVKQLASRIAEAALGIGREGSDKRPTERVYAPCHAVVIENLKNYRPDELQTRRENRQLMDWSSAKVRKHLSEACQLHGLHLREISPAYTSRQCSRTGLPGARCQDVPVWDFLNAPIWRRRTTVAEDKKANGKGTGVDAYLVELAEALRGVTLEQAKAMRPLLLPVRGGDLFVSAAGRVVQADLNAAANIGLRAIMDPDFPGRWWYVPCDSKTMQAETKEKLKGCALFNGTVPLLDGATNGGRKKGKAKEREIANVWRDVSVAAPEEDRTWSVFQAYWAGVESRVVVCLQKINGRRQGWLAPWM